MSTVAIIGAGDLGGAVAQALAATDSVRRVLIVDAAAGPAAGKALDIQQSGAVSGFHTQLSATADLDAVIGAGACVIADRFGSPAEEWNGPEGLALLERLLPFLARTPIVFAGARQAGLMSAAAADLSHQLGRERLIGSAPEAFASAVRAIVAVEAACSPSEVSIAVLGAPPDGLVIPWSEASVGGYAAERVLTAVQIARLEARAARLWPPGPLTLGLAAARVAEGIVRSSRRRFSVLTKLSGEFGVRNRIGALPALLSPSGIASVRVPSLNTRERVQLETALASSGS